MTSQSHLKDVPPEFLAECIKVHEQTLEEMYESVNAAKWDPYSNKKGVEVSTRTKPGEHSEFLVSKMVCTIDAPQEAWIDAFTMHKLFTPETMPQGPMKPVEMYAIYENMESEHQDLIYSVCMPKPMAFVDPREFFNLRRKYVKDDKTIFLQKSIVNDDLQPVRPGCIRGENYGQLFMIEKDPANPDKSIYTMISQVNPGGSLPSFAGKFAINNQIDAMIEIKKICEDHYQKDILPNK